jgi:hypothetical protein
MRGKRMSKIVRYEFIGSWMIFWLYWISIIGFPVAFLYLINNTIHIETELDNPEDFVEKFRAGKKGAKRG